MLPSSEGIINEVRQNPNAIGYDGLGYVPDDLKMIAIAKKAGEAYVLPSVATVNDKTYAIARDLYMYTAGEATGAIKDYLDWIISPEAQAIVTELGFVPIKSVLSMQEFRPASKRYSYTLLLAFTVFYLALAGN